MRKLISAIAVTLPLAAAGTQLCSAEEMEDLYRGKTISFVVGHGVGTGFDIYARALAHHLARHIPGNPSIIVQNMGGASGMTAANWLYNIAPKDGTVIATFVHTVPFEPMLGNSAARFDPSKFTWIGNMEESVGICGVSKASGIRNFDDLLHKEAVFGATGASGQLRKFSVAVKNLLGAKIKLVTGYKSSADVKLALDRGEIQGVCGLPMSTVTSFWRDDYASGALKPIIQLSGKKLPELKDIPHAADYAKSDEARQLFGLVFETQALGRLVVGPPGMPSEQKKALRTAFTTAMTDAQFLAEADKTQINIAPTNGEEVERLIAHLTAASREIVEKAKAALKE